MQNGRSRIPGNSRGNFSKDIFPGIPGNSRTGIPGGLGPDNKRLSEKSSKTTVDGDGHHSTEKALFIRPHLQNVR